MRPLRDFLREVVQNWEHIAIRVYQDDRWQSLFLSEIKNDSSILEWINEARGYPS